MHPNGYPQVEVFEKAATKKDDHNHPNSLQRVNYRKENVNISGNDSCTQDYSSLENQRLSLEKIHGQPFKKACSKSCGSSSALGGKRMSEKANEVPKTLLESLESK